MNSNFEVEVKGHGMCPVKIIDRGLKIIQSKKSFKNNEDGYLFGIVHSRTNELIARFDNIKNAIKCLDKLNDISDGSGIWTMKKHELLALSNEQKQDIDRVAKDINLYLMTVDAELSEKRIPNGLKETEKYGFPRIKIHNSVIEDNKDISEEYKEYHLNKPYNYGNHRGEEKVPEEKKDTLQKSSSRKKRKRK